MARRVTEDEKLEFKRLYLDEGLSILEIGNRFGRNSTVVWRWLHRMGVPLRPQGSSAGVKEYTGLFRSNGMKNHPHYPTWYSMMYRCYSPKSASWENYGGRGIEVFGPWHDPRVYIEYVETILGPKPVPGYTIDRLDNDGNYKPGNIQWADKRKQRLNQARVA